MAYELIEDGQILTTEEIITPVQAAIVRRHHTWGLHIIASWDEVTGMLHAEYRHPTIDGTNWQGQVVTGEERAMSLRIDGSDPVDLTVVAGVAEEALVFESPGTYRLEVTSQLVAGLDPEGQTIYTPVFGAEPVVLEVVIP